MQLSNDFETIDAKPLIICLIESILSLISNLHISFSDTKIRNNNYNILKEQLEQLADINLLIC